MALPHESVDNDELPDNGSIWLEGDEARAYFDKSVHELLGMSGEEFLRRLDAGEWAEVIDDGEHNDHIYLAMMRSLAR
jgi:hypothetical protein